MAFNPISKMRNVHSCVQIAYFVDVSKPEILTWLGSLNQAVFKRVSSVIEFYELGLAGTAKLRYLLFSSNISFLSTIILKNGTT